VIGFADRSADRGTDVSHLDVHGPAPACYATSLLGGHSHHGEDVVQETLLRLWQRPEDTSVPFTALAEVTFYGTPQKLHDASSTTLTAEIGNPAEPIGTTCRRSKPVGILTARCRSKQASAVVRTIRGSVG
jgi:hypothetical protein